MTSQVGLNVLLAIGLSVVSCSALAYAKHDRQHDYQPAKTVKVTKVHPSVAPAKSNGRAFSPHVAWKKRDVLPQQYRARNYHVYGYNAFGLQRPAKNQQWFKIRGDYVLVNLLNHRVVNIVAGR